MIRFYSATSAMPLTSHLQYSRRRNSPTGQPKATDYHTRRSRRCSPHRVDARLGILLKRRYFSSQGRAVAIVYLVELLSNRFRTLGLTRVKLEFISLVRRPILRIAAVSVTVINVPKDTEMRFSFLILDPPVNHPLLNVHCINNLEDYGIADIYG